MEFICGAVDFVSQQKFNPPKSFDGLKKTVYSDNHITLFHIFDNTTKASVTIDNIIAEITIDDTKLCYTPVLKTINFSCGKSGIHRLFFTFVGSALLFSTNLSILVPSDTKPKIFFGSNAYSNITELSRGCFGSFSAEGLKFY